MHMERLAKPEVTPRPTGSRKVLRFFRIFWRVVFASLFLVFTFFAAAFLFPQQVLTVDSGAVKGDILVVLGGGDGRAERGAELYHQGEAPSVLVTGYGDCESNIATLERLGVPASVITPEPAALTTLQNATLSVPLLRAMRVHRVILVTSWFHSRRALACFRHVAPDLQFYSRPSYLDYEPKNLNREGYSWHVNYEYAKLVGYWISYGVCPL
jgi:uncharacterized SAM-binding protein YcdF (DUF218 family)